MTAIVTILESDIAEGWAYIKKEAVSLYVAVQPILAAPLKAFDTLVVQDLWGAGVALVTKLIAAGQSLNLADLETAFLNSLSALGAQLLSAAQALGSNLLQALLGLLEGHVTANA